MSDIIKSQESNLEDTQPDVKEIINRSPSFVVTSGNLILLILFVLLFILSLLIKVPEVFKGPVKIFSTNGPKLVRSNLDGTLLSLFQPDNHSVSADDTIAIVGSTSNYQEIISVKDFVGKITKLIRNHPVYKLDGYSIPEFENLGEVQAAFNQFFDSFNELKFFMEGNYFENYSKFLKDERSNYSDLRNQYQSSIVIAQKELEIYEQQLEMGKKLFAQRAISQVDLDTYKVAVLRKKAQIAELIGINKNVLIQKISKEKEILDFQKSWVEKKNNFSVATFGLENAIRQWGDNHIIIAKETGVLEYKDNIQVHQSVTKNQILFNIVPLNLKYFGILKAHQKNFGKVKVGQEVRIALNSYPFSEFGYLIGKLTNVSSTPDANGNYDLKVDVNSIFTTSNRRIIFQEGLDGEASVVVDKIPFIKKVFYQVKFKDY